MQPSIRYLTHPQTYDESKKSIFTVSREWNLKIVTVLFTLTNAPGLGKRSLSPISTLSRVIPPPFHDLREKPGFIHYKSS